MAVTTDKSFKTSVPRNTRWNLRVSSKAPTWQKLETVEGCHLRCPLWQHGGLDDRDGDAENRASPGAAHVGAGHLGEVEALWEPARIHAYTAKGNARKPELL